MSLDDRQRLAPLGPRCCDPAAGRYYRVPAPLAQRQSNGLLIRRFWVQIPGGAPRGLGGGQVRRAAQADFTPSRKFPFPHNKNFTIRSRTPYLPTTIRQNPNSPCPTTRFSPSLPSSPSPKPHSLSTFPHSLSRFSEFLINQGKTCISAGQRACYFGACEHFHNRNGCVLYSVRRYRTESGNRPLRQLSLEAPAYAAAAPRAKHLRADRAAVSRAREASTAARGVRPGEGPAQLRRPTGPARDHLPAGLAFLAVGPPPRRGLAAPLRPRTGGSTPELGAGLKVLVTGLAGAGSRLASRPRPLEGP